jgi:hypothetical protein
MKSFRLINEAVKRNCLAYISGLPAKDESPLIVTVKEEGRTLDQNSLLWPLLECFSEQLQWPVNGRMANIDSEAWKDILTAAYRNETQRVAAGLNGGMVLLGMRTSKMTKAEFSEFIEFLYAVGAERGINFKGEA